MTARDGDADNRRRLIHSKGCSLDVEQGQSTHHTLLGPFDRIRHAAPVLLSLATSAGQERKEEDGTGEWKAQALYVESRARAKQSPRRLPPKKPREQGHG